MRKSKEFFVRRCLITLGVIAIGVCTAKAQVPTRLIQLDDLGDTVILSVDGDLITRFVEGQIPVIMDAGVILPSSIDMSWNIYEFAGGPLSDTLHIFGSQGANLEIAFLSDVEGQTLSALPNASSLIETGDWQTPFSQQLLDQAGAPILETVQFRSDVETTVPDGGSSLALMGIALAGLTAAARRFRS